MVTARQSQGLVHTWRTLAEEQPAAVCFRGDERVEAPDGRCAADVASGMFDGEAFSADQVGVLLSVAEVYDDPVAVYLLQRSLEENAFPHVRFFVFPVRIEVDHVSSAEIRQEVIPLPGYAECHRVAAVGRGAAFFAHESQFCVDVACLLLLCQGHVPEVGTAVSHALLRSHFRYKLFLDDKGHHTHEVGSFQAVEPVEGCKCLRKLWQEVFMIEPVVLFPGVQCLWGKQWQYSANSVLCHPELRRHGLVAEADGLVQERLQRLHLEQSVGQRIFRVHQPDVCLFRGKAEVVLQNAVVEEQLYIMFLHME